MFKSDLFAGVFATVSGAEVELYNTDGAQGAARGAGIGCGIYSSAKKAFKSLDVVKRVSPDKKLTDVYADCYGRWEETLRNTWLRSRQETPVTKSVK
jgi:xylulokinase